MQNCKFFTHHFHNYYHILYAIRYAVSPPHDESIYWAIQNVKEDSGFQLTLARMC